MAIVASITALHVGRVFPGGYQAVVTGTACPDYLGMVNGEYWREYIGRMAVFTHIAGLYMR